jgi:hypothetical protein
MKLHIYTIAFLLLSAFFIASGQKTEEDKQHERLEKMTIEREKE